ncbi:MAG: YlmH/Sll1252 family protein [Acutalibacteraceae bacterium]|nr:YlmH/Sll1252 family protein [Acutalibacteraceae bacterium]
METDLFKARIKDTADICHKTSRPKYLGFLSAEEAVLAGQLLKNATCRTSFYGGYQGAERQMLGCFPDWMEEDFFPINALTFKYRESDTLSHRDFLGSLMALGIKRETVGDILTEQGRAVVFVTDEIYEYIKNQVTKIGRTGVTVIEGYIAPLPKGDKLAEFTDTAASDRIDCIISALCGFSRAAALEALSQGLVTVNSVSVSKATKSVCEGDIVSVRGKGRFLIGSLENRTKKNRIIVNYKKYI